MNSQKLLYFLIVSTALVLGGCILNHIPLNDNP